MKARIKEQVWQTPEEKALLGSRFGSVVFSKPRGMWVYLWWEGRKRRSRTIGTLAEFPNRTAAWLTVKKKRMEQPEPNPKEGSVRELVQRYRQERMPQRESTRRGYNAWLDNHIIPKWGDRSISCLQPRPVELWLRTLPVSPKSKSNIRGLLGILWDFAMWRGDVPIERNPMELVRIETATARTREPRVLTVEQFQALLQQFENDLCFRTMILLAVSFGLRISEVLGLKWQDVDWQGKMLSIERGIVKQIQGEVKTRTSAKRMLIDDDLLEVLRQWKAAAQFSESEDWMFASPVKIGRLPLSYTFVWETLSDAATKAGLGHVSSHVFRLTYRTWLDSVGTPVGVQQKLMRHADIRTTMNILRKCRHR